MSKYIVLLEPAEKGGYIVSCPAFPGCVTQGDTVEEALAMIQDAIQGFIFSMNKHGEPAPSGLDEAEKVALVEV